MSSVSWIKIRVDMWDDEKIRLIEQLPDADRILVVWLKLLTLAGLKNSLGQIFVNDEMPYTDEMLAAIFHRPVNVVRMALTAFQKFRMVEISANQTIIICNWAKHQNVEGMEKIRQQNLERKQRQRQRQIEQYLLSCGGHVTRHVTLRDAVTQNGVTERDQIENKKEKREEVPSAVSLEGRQSQLRISNVDEAKRLICEKILNGKDPARPWSYEAQARLSELCGAGDPPGLPLQEILDIAWFRSLPKVDEVPELKNRRDPITETTLMSYWGDELTRAREYRRKCQPERTKDKEPPRWREFYRWKYGPEVVLPQSFYQLDLQQRQEYERDFETFAKATSKAVAAV
jgi:predicted phage replisome organizer